MRNTATRATIIIKYCHYRQQLDWIGWPIVVWSQEHMWVVNSWQPFEANFSVGNAIYYSYLIYIYIEGKYSTNLFRLVTPPCKANFSKNSCLVLSHTDARKRLSCDSQLNIWVVWKAPQIICHHEKYLTTFKKTCRLKNAVKFFYWNWSELFSITWTILCGMIFFSNFLYIVKSKKLLFFYHKW